MSRNRDRHREHLQTLLLNRRMTSCCRVWSARYVAGCFLQCRLPVIPGCYKADFACKKQTFGRVTLFLPKSIVIVPDTQCFSFLDFLIILSVATYRAYRPALAASGLSTVDLSPLKTMLSVIMITAVLILLRTVFRMAETAEGECELRAAIHQNSTPCHPLPSDSGMASY